MKERPILFSTDMVRSILNGTKTQTRRVVKPMPSQKDWLNDDLLQSASGGDTINLNGETWVQLNYPKTPTNNIAGVHFYSNSPLTAIKCPYGQVGDHLWVRETITKPHPTQIGWYRKSSLTLEQIENVQEMGFKWLPSIFMPKDKCCLFLEITSISIERLHEISEDDAISEGVKKMPYQRGYYDYMDNSHPLLTAKDSYFSLWESINGKESLDSNPHVWVLEFKKI